MTHVKMILNPRFSKDKSPQIIWEGEPKVLPLEGHQVCVLENKGKNKYYVVDTVLHIVSPNSDGLVINITVTPL